MSWNSICPWFITPLLNHFEKRTSLILLFSVKTYKAIEQLKRMSWANFVRVYEFKNFLLHFVLWLKQLFLPTVGVFFVARSTSWHCLTGICFFIYYQILIQRFKCSGTNIACIHLNGFISWQWEVSINIQAEIIHVMKFFMQRYCIRSHLQIEYGKTSNISCTWVGNKIVDQSDEVGAPPVGAAPAVSAFST